MQYDDIFPKPITEYTDEEIIARARELRAISSKIKKHTKASTTARPTTNNAAKKSKAELMLETALAKANLTKKKPS